MPKLAKPLSAKEVAAAKPQEKDYKLFDGQGLHLFVSKSGSKLWRLKYRFASKDKIMSIGSYPEVSLQEARTKALEARRLVIDNIDPVEARREEKNATEQQETAKVRTVTWLVNEWDKAHHRILKGNEATTAKEKADTLPLAESTRKRNRILIDTHILAHKDFADLAILDVRRKHIVALLKSYGMNKSTPSRVKQLLNRVFTYALDMEYLEYSPVIHLESTAVTPKATHRPAILDLTELAELLYKLDQYKGSATVAAALKLLPLVFQRPGELTAMEWSEIDFEAATWTIPEHKKKERNQTSGDHIVPLSKQAIAILKELHRTTGRAQYVFRNQQNPRTHMPSDSLNKALRNLGYCTKTEQSAHGFRAIARTIIDEQLNVRPDWIELQLAHSPKDQNGRAYNRTRFMPERTEMMQSWADYIDQLKHQHESGNVIAADFKKERA